MKYKQSQQQVSVHLMGALMLIGGLCISAVALAHNKVVVIPLGDDAIAHPVAKTFTNSIGMQFNELPAGSFTMGSPSGVCPLICQIAEPGRYTGEVQHSVTLSKAYNMQTTEITNAQWNDVIVDSALGVNPAASHQGDNHYPVDSVSWYDAVFFANRLSLDEGRSNCYIFSGSSGSPGSNLNITTVTMNSSCTGYRLPTEAEWEYAARAGTGRAYANPIGFDRFDTEIGSGFNGNLHAMGWYVHNNASMGYTAGTKPVAKKQPNAWDLYDMHGNVWEWSWDRYRAYSGNVTDPSGPVGGTNRVLRGGSWADVARFTRSATRFDFSPDVRSSFVGFRLVLPRGQ